MGSDMQHVLYFWKLGSCRISNMTNDDMFEASRPNKSLQFWWGWCTFVEGWLDGRRGGEYGCRISTVEKVADMVVDMEPPLETEEIAGMVMDMVWRMAILGHYLQGSFLYFWYQLQHLQEYILFIEIRSQQVKTIGGKPWQLLFKLHKQGTRTI